MRCWSISVLLVAALLLSMVPASGPLNDGIEQSVAPAFESPDLGFDGAVAGAFTTNMGQVENADVRFYTDSGIAMGNGWMMLQVASPASESAIQEISTVRFNFVGANHVEPEGIGKASWQSSFFLGNRSSDWITEVDNYRAVLYRDLWDGIDLAYRMTDAGLKYDLIVGPGADVSSIGIKPEGHGSMRLDSTDSLTITTRTGSTIVDSGLEVYYADAPSEALDAAFVIDDAGHFSFSVPERDPSRTLVIDPLVYSTFMGGTGQDSANSVTSDSFGNAYVTGHTASVKFSSQPGLLQAGGNADHNLFVAKIAPDGTSILYVAILGGQEYETGHAIAVDSSGSAYVTGETFSAGFPVSDAAFDRGYNGVGDAFALKLNAAGSSLVYSTFLGGRHDDAGYGIAVDEAGQAHVTGMTWSTDFHTTGGAFNAAPNGDADAFLTKLADTGDYLVYSTYLGGLGSDSGAAIALDNDGNAYITGTCMPAGFPVTEGTMNRSGSTIDVFVTKFGKNGNAPLLSAVLGGSGSDSAAGIIIDSDGAIHIVGDTDSRDFPTTPDAPYPALRGARDVFILGLNSSGDMLLHSTYLGGSKDDSAGGISVGQDGRIFIAGGTMSSDFPVTSGALAKSIRGGSDAFISVMNETGLEYSTFLGGSHNDIGLGLTLTLTGCPIISGMTASPNFLMVPGAPWPVHSGGSDGFLAKLDLIVPIAIAGPDILANESTSVEFNGTASHDNEAVTNHTWTFNDGIADITLYGPNPTHIFIRPGKYNVTLEACDRVGNPATDNLTVTVLIYPYPIARAGSDMESDIGAVARFDGSASTDNGEIIRYIWTFHDGLNNASVEGREPTWIFRMPGNYSVVLDIIDDDGNIDSDTFNISVTDISAPLAVPGDFIALERGNEARLDGSASTDNAAIQNYTWTFTHNGTVITLNGANSSFVFWEPGPHEITLTVTDAAGNSDSNTMLVTVTDPGHGIAMKNVLGAAMLVVSIIILLAVLAATRRRKGGEGD